MEEQKSPLTSGSGIEYPYKWGGVYGVRSIPIPVEKALKLPLNIGNDISCFFVGKVVVFEKKKFFYFNPQVKYMFGEDGLDHPKKAGQPDDEPKFTTESRAYIYETAKKFGNFDEMKKMLSHEAYDAAKRGDISGIIQRCEQIRHECSSLGSDSIRKAFSNIYNFAINKAIKRQDAKFIVNLHRAKPEHCQFLYEEIKNYQTDGFAPLSEEVLKNLMEELHKIDQEAGF